MSDLPPFHPACEMFPLIDGEEFDALVADISQHGLRELIVTYIEPTTQRRTIIDGRNRARACIQAGLEPQYQDKEFPGG
jgi:ParB-like chromosome segregation protein Spo0J